MASSREKKKKSLRSETGGGGEASPARYVAIITDGNGRWAQQRGLPVNEGHEAGADNVKARLRDAVELGIEELTVFSFSTENWSRSSQEVDGLMQMFRERIDRETPELDDEGVRMRFIGRRDGISPELIERMDWAQDVTKGNDRITLFVAFNYGGRAEIVDAARSFQGATEEEFRGHLYAPDMHDPDLLIRTSGEQRLSNYLLWQCAYSELVFRDELWPDFDREAFAACLDEFDARQRRFGAR
jgi:undecaprenyl diphosphate synthase